MKGKNFMVLNYKNLQGLTYILNIIDCRNSEKLKFPAD